jgi:hypothetical protein
MLSYECGESLIPVGVKQIKVFLGVYILMQEEARAHLLLDLLVLPLE